MGTVHQLQASLKQTKVLQQRKGAFAQLTIIFKGLTAEILIVANILW